jgi:hypothetical protein
VNREDVNMLVNYLVATTALVNGVMLGAAMMLAAGPCARRMMRRACR